MPPPEGIFGYATDIFVLSYRLLGGEDSVQDKIFC